MWFSIAFGFGVLVGALLILGIEALVVLAVIERLNQRASRLVGPSSELDHNQSLDFSFNKQGVIWVLPSSKVPRDWADNGNRVSKDQKRKKELFEVSPVKKQAQLNGQTLILTESDGTKAVLRLKGCCVEAVSASLLASRKWAKRFPIKLENKVSPIYNECKTLYIYLETSWDKESWCKALCLASSEDRTKLEWSVKLQKEFRGYLTALNDGYPLFMKPSAGLYAADFVDRVQRIDGSSSSKVRTLWKKITKKASKGITENRTSWPTLNNLERKVDSSPSTSLLRSAQLAESVKLSLVDDLDYSPKLSYSGSQGQSSVISDTDTSDKFCVDEGTLCWNLLISRFFFDSKRNLELRKSIQARIQRTLANMRTPSYIGEVICTDVDIGNLPPYLHSMKVLPMDSNEVWAFDIDIEYSGGIVLGIETRLEVRELDPEKAIVASNVISSSVGDVSSELLEGFEHFEKRLDLGEGTNEEALDHKEESQKLDQSQGSTNSLPASTNRWKSILNNIAKQVSQVPISLAIRVAALRGTVRLHIKPPPSDQLWFAFTSMPDIEFNLDSSVGDHKITNGQIATFLVNRIRMAIQETMVLPNCESVGIPFMLAEKDDWVPRNVAPFTWIHRDSPSELASSNHVLGDESRIEQHQKTEANNNEAIQHVSKSREIEPVQSSSAGPLDQILEELRTPLLGNDEETQASGSHSGGETEEYRSTPSRSPQVAGDDDSKPKRLGRRARMFDLGKKVGDKLEEKRRHLEEKSKQIVEKMRGT